MNIKGILQSVLTYLDRLYVLERKGLLGIQCVIMFV